MQPKYPVYVPSKGRWELRHTIKALEAMQVPYYVVVEREELDQYAAVVASGEILVLPFSNRGLIAARCWIMDHSIAQGDVRHWQIDDNIRAFYRLHQNIKYRAKSGTVFRAAEDFVDRYENVAYAGFQYEMFAPRKKKHPPLIMNTRVYSCTLVDNSIPYRWRSVYNDDTDVSLMALKGGWCTVLFLAFLADKIETMRVSGGNTDALYQGDGRLKMAQQLQRYHPDVVKVVYKWGRWQHQVDYRPFKGNKLKLREGVEVPQGVNNYGMRLVDLADLTNESG